MTLILFGPPASAGVEILADQGRRTQTGPREAQIAVNGFAIDDQAPLPTPSGYTLSEQGRLLHARPTQSVLVGLVGCPGCDRGLEIIEGLYLGIDRGFVDQRHRRRARLRKPPNVDRRPHRRMRGSNNHD